MSMNVTSRTAKPNEERTGGNPNLPEDLCLDKVATETAEAVVALIWANGDYSSAQKVTQILHVMRSYLQALRGDLAGREKAGRLSALTIHQAMSWIAGERGSIPPELQGPMTCMGRTQHQRKFLKEGSRDARPQTDDVQ